MTSPTKSQPRHIGAIIETLLQDKGYDGKVRANRAVLLWDGVVGEVVAKRSRAHHVEHGTLYVDVNNSVWMHKLQMQATEFKDRINRELGKKAIEQIRFRLIRTSRQRGD